MGAPSTSQLVLAAVLLVATVSSPAAAGGGKHHPFGPEKVTNLHFYLHDTLSGKDPSAVLAAHGANAVSKPGDPTPFSSIYVVDDALTEGPDRSSKVVGNAQGMYMSSGSHGVPALVLGIDYELTDGPFNGSSFVVYSRNPITRPVGRELAIVGGRGAFRLARGFALLKTHYLDMSNGDAIIEYNVTLVHH